MQKTSTHHSIQVKCTMDEPIQLLIDKLSTKSTDLYVFWQNYNQLYRQYNQKISQNCKLKQQIQIMRRTLNQPRQPEVRVTQDPYLKQRLKSAEINSQGLRSQNDKLKAEIKDMKIQNTRFIQQMNQLQVLIAQLRQQNSQQRISIANILQKLKAAQNEINGYAKVYQQVQQKEAIIGGLVQKQKQMRILLEQKDDEIQQLTKACENMKHKYEKIIKQSLQNAKQTVMNSITPNYKYNPQKARARDQF